MLHQLVISVRGNVGMKDGTGQYQKIKQNGGVFFTEENNAGAQSTDEDPDCWSDLWQCIRTRGSRLLK